MKKNINGFLAIVAMMLVLASCSKKEAAITPSGIKDGYTLPQGNNAYDQTIVNYFNKYGSYMLYQFTYKDIYWTPTGYTVPTEYSGGYWSSGQEVSPSIGNYIPQQLSLMQNCWFKFYSDQFLKKFLPVKILLCSKVDSVGAQYDFSTFQYTKLTKKVGAYYYYDNICVNYGDASVTSLTKADSITFIKKVNRIFIESIIGRKQTAATTAFIGSADYKTAMTSYDQAYARGILSSYYGPTPLDDWNIYMLAMVSLSETQLNTATPIPGPYDTATLLGILNPEKDTNRQIRKRYTMVRDYFISTYNVDLQLIGNAANP